MGVGTSTRVRPEGGVGGRGGRKYKIPHLNHRAGQIDVPGVPAVGVLRAGILERGTRTLGEHRFLTPTLAPAEEGGGEGVVDCPPLTARSR